MNNIFFNPKHKIIKIIAAIVCVCFLWQDVVWAAGSDFLRQRQIYVEGEPAKAPASGHDTASNLIQYLPPVILAAGMPLTLYLLRNFVRSHRKSMIWAENKKRKINSIKAYGIPVRSLLNKVPLELDAWLDKPVEVALWVADHDETLNMTGAGKIRQDILNYICDSLTKTKALWMIFTGSAVDEETHDNSISQTDIGWRTLKPLEDRLLNQKQHEALSRLWVLGAIGQQIIGHNKKGQRTYLENKNPRSFTRPQQSYIMQMWLKHFVRQYYATHLNDKTSAINYDELTSDIENANTPAQLEAIAAKIEKALNLSRFEIIRRGINPDTRRFDVNFAGTISFHLPLDNSLEPITRSFVDIFNSCISPEIPAGVKPIVNGGAYLTVTLYSKDEELRRIYPKIAKSLPKDGIIVMAGDNPDADTFFRTNSSDFERPVLKFLLNNKKAGSYPGLLASRRDYVNGAKEIMAMLLNAEQKRIKYRNLRLFNGPKGYFSIADIEKETGLTWKELRTASASAAGAQRWLVTFPQENQTHNIVLADDGECDAQIKTALNKTINACLKELQRLGSEFKEILGAIEFVDMDTAGGYSLTDDEKTGMRKLQIDKKLFTDEGLKDKRMPVLTEALQAAGQDISAEQTLQHWLDAFDNGLDLSRRNWVATPQAFRRALVRRLAELAPPRNPDRRPHELTVPNFTSVRVREKGVRVTTLGSLYSDYTGTGETEEGQVLTKLLHDLSDPDAENGILLPRDEDRVFIWHTQETERAKKAILKFIINCAIYHTDLDEPASFRTPRLDATTGQPAVLSSEELRTFLLNYGLLRHERWTDSMFSRLVFRQWYFATTGIVNTVAKNPENFYKMIEEALTNPEMQKNAKDEHGVTLPVITIDELRTARSPDILINQLTLFFRYNRFIREEILRNLEADKKKQEEECEKWMEKVTKPGIREDTKVYQNALQKAEQAEQKVNEITQKLEYSAGFFEQLYKLGMEAVTKEIVPGRGLLTNQPLLKQMDEWTDYIRKRLNEICGINEIDEAALDIFTAIETGLFSEAESGSDDDREFLRGICHIFGGNTTRPSALHEVDPQALKEFFASANSAGREKMESWHRLVLDRMDIVTSGLRRLGVRGRIDLTRIGSHFTDSPAFASVRNTAEELEAAVALKPETAINALDYHGRFGVLLNGLPAELQNSISITTFSDETFGRLKLAQTARQGQHRLVLREEQQQVLENERGSYDFVTSIFGLDNDNKQAFRELVMAAQNALMPDGLLIIAIPGASYLNEQTIENMQRCGFELVRQTAAYEQMDIFQPQLGALPRFTLAVLRKKEDIGLSQIDSGTLNNMSVSRIHLQGHTRPSPAAPTGPFKPVHPAEAEIITKGGESMMAARPKYSEEEELAHMIKMVIKYRDVILHNEGPKSYLLDYYKALADPNVVQVNILQDDVKTITNGLEGLSDMTKRKIAEYLRGLLYALREKYKTQDGFSVFEECPYFESWMETIYLHRNNEDIFSQEESIFIENFAQEAWLNPRPDRPPTKYEAGWIMGLFFKIRRYRSLRQRLFWIATHKKKQDSTRPYILAGDDLSISTPLMTHFSAMHVAGYIRKHIIDRFGEPLGAAKAVFVDVGAGPGTCAASLYNLGLRLGAGHVQLIEVDNNPNLLQKPRNIYDPAISQRVTLETTKALGDAQELDNVLSGVDTAGAPVGIGHGEVEVMTAFFLIHLFKGPQDTKQFFVQARKWIKKGGMLALSYPSDTRFAPEFIKALQELGFAASAVSVGKQQVSSEAEKDISDWLLETYPDIWENRTLKEKVFAKVRQRIEKNFAALILWKQKEVDDRTAQNLDANAFRIQKPQMPAAPKAAPKIKIPAKETVDLERTNVDIIADSWLCHGAKNRDFTQQEPAIISRRQVLEHVPHFGEILQRCYAYRQLFPAEEQAMIAQFYDSWIGAAPLCIESQLDRLLQNAHLPLLVVDLSNAQRQLAKQKYPAEAGSAGLQKGLWVTLEFIRHFIREDRPLATLALPKEALLLINYIRRPDDDARLSLTQLAGLEKWASALMLTPEGKRLGQEDGLPFAVRPSLLYEFIDVFRNTYMSPEAAKRESELLPWCTRERLQGLFQTKQARQEIISLLQRFAALTEPDICYNFWTNVSVVDSIKDSSKDCAGQLVGLLYRNFTEEKRRKGKVTIITEGWAEASINEICKLFPDIENPMTQPAEQEKGERFFQEVTPDGWPEFAVLDLAAILDKKIQEFAGGVLPSDLDTFFYDFVTSDEIVYHPFLRARPIEEITKRCQWILDNLQEVRHKLSVPEEWQFDKGERQLMNLFFAELARSQTADKTIRMSRLLSNLVSARNSANRKQYARIRLLANGFRGGDLEFRESAERLEMRQREDEYKQFISDVSQVEHKIDEGTTDNETILENAIKNLTNYIAVLDDPDTDNLLKIIVCSNVSIYMTKFTNDLTRLLYKKISGLPVRHPLKAYFSEEAHLAKRSGLKEALGEYFSKYPFQLPAEISYILKSEDQGKKTELLMALQDLFINENNPYVLHGVFLTFYDLISYQHPSGGAYLRAMFEYIELCFTMRFANIKADVGISAYLNYQLAQGAEILLHNNSTAIYREFIARLYRSRTTGWTEILAKINESEDFFNGFNTADFENLINSLELMKFTTMFSVGFTGQQEEFDASTIGPETFINLDNLIDTLSFPQGKETILYHLVKKHKELLAGIAVRAIDRYMEENPSASLQQRLDYASYTMQRLGILNIIDKRPLEPGCFDANDVQFYEHMALTVRAGCVFSKKDAGVKETFDGLFKGTDAGADDIEKIKALEASWQEFFPYESADEWINQHKQCLKNWFMANAENQKKMSFLFKEQIATKEETAVLRGIIEVFLKSPDEDAWGQINGYMLDGHSVPKAVAFIQLIHKRKAVTENQAILENIDRLWEYSSGLRKALGFIEKNELQEAGIFNSLRAYLAMGTVYNDQQTDMADRIRLMEKMLSYDQLGMDFVRQADEQTKQKYAGWVSVIETACEESKLHTIRFFREVLGVSDGDIIIENVQNAYGPAKNLAEYIPPDRHNEFDKAFSDMLSHTNPAAVNVARRNLAIRVKELAEIQNASLAKAGGGQQEELVELIVNILRETIKIPDVGTQLEVLTPILFIYPLNVRKLLAIASSVPDDFLNFTTWLHINGFVGLSEEQISERLKTTQESYPWFLLEEGSFPDDFGQKFLQFQTAWEALFPEHLAVNWRRIWFDIALENVLNCDFFKRSGLQEKQETPDEVVDSALEYTESLRLIRLLNEGVVAHTPEESRQAVEQLYTSAAALERYGLFKLIQMHKDCQSVANDKNEPADNRQKAAIGLRALEGRLTEELPAGPKRSVITYLLQDLHNLTPWVRGVPARLVNNVDWYNSFFRSIFTIALQRGTAFTILQTYEAIITGLLISKPDFRKRIEFLDYLADGLNDYGAIREDFSSFDRDAAKSSRFATPVLFCHLLKTILPAPDLEYIRNRMRQGERHIKSTEGKVILVPKSVINTNTGVCVLLDQLYGKWQQFIIEVMQMPINLDIPADRTKILKFIIETIQPDKPDFSLLVSFFFTGTKQTLFQGIGIRAPGYETAGFKKQPVLNTINTISDLFMWAMTIRPDVRDKVRELTLSDDPVASLTACDLIVSWIEFLTHNEPFSPEFNEEIMNYAEGTWNILLNKSGWQLDERLRAASRIFFEHRDIDQTTSRKISALFFDMFAKNTEANMDKLKAAMQAGGKSKLKWASGMKDIYEYLLQFVEDGPLRDDFLKVIDFYDTAARGDDANAAGKRASAIASALGRAERKMFTRYAMALSAVSLAENILLEHIRAKAKNNKVLIITTSLNEAMAAELSLRMMGFKKIDRIINPSLTDKEIMGLAASFKGDYDFVAAKTTSYGYALIHYSQGVPINTKTSIPDTAGLLKEIIDCL